MHLCQRIPLWILTLFLLTACNRIPQPLPLPAPISNLLAPAPETSALPPTLELMTYAGSQAEADYIAQQVETFNAGQPQITVTLSLPEDYATSLDDAFDSDAPPDIFRVPGFQLPAHVASGSLAPLPIQYSSLDRIYPTLQDGFAVDGTAYCFPIDVHLLALAYNRDLFDKASIPYPTPDWNWSDLRSAAEALTDLPNGIYGITLNADFSRWLPFLYQAGGTVLDRERQTMMLDTQLADDAMEYYFALFWDGVGVEPLQLNNTWSGEVFGRGSAAMTIEGNWLQPYLAANYPLLNYGVEELPAGPGGKATVAFTSCLAIAADSPHKDAALTFAAYLTSPETIPEWLEHTNGLPATTELGAIWTTHRPDHSPYFAGIDDARVWQFPPKFQEAIDIFNFGLRNALDGNVYTEDVLSRTQEIGNTILAGD